MKPLVSRSAPDAQPGSSIAENSRITKAFEEVEKEKPVLLRSGSLRGH
jgi:hypothetical protein